MARSSSGPINDSGELRNHVDKHLVASLALGYGLGAYVSLSGESLNAAQKAVPRLIECLPGIQTRYELLVWAFSRSWMLDMEYEGHRYSRQAYERWLAVVGKVAVGFTADQRDFLLECLSKHTQSLRIIWSEPERDNQGLVRDILATAGLDAGGWKTFCIIISAAAWAGVLRLPGDDPQPPAPQGDS